MSKVIEVQNLTKNFGKFTALDKVNLNVNKGEIHGFIGPNGAGKSTTIRVLLGMLKADSGQVKVFDQDAWKQSVDIHRRIAYVPGDANLWPNLTGGQTIDLLLKMHGSQVNQARLDDLIQRFELDPTKKSRTYSKGNRQKVVLIAAFAADVDLYILDEPTSGLDPLMERLFQELVCEAKENGKSVLLSSHILSEVERLCDSVSIIRNGQIIESDTLDELRHLTRSKLTIQTENPVTDLAQLEGVHDLVEMDGNQYQMQIESQKLNAIMQHLSDFNLVKLESQPPTLEDLFLHHYENPQGGQ
ncbi:ABC transporter ATP-binding protein [Ruoffia tabacinasalis]|uniref:ABC transporter ATP-binding protein n=1 Tax=Ruoffia tabacinasalis TaxID=87458 RepID=A0ABS0LIZ2_9LACT|nr:ABC transporter ATP-binding protein [Ruoffia tabacinasalis]MBG9978124.1 ABC transporter ATP-binding protein [Ruoffia tabacinasalis]